jgi:hypothetical protein
MIEMRMGGDDEDRDDDLDEDWANVEHHSHPMGYLNYPTPLTNLPPLYVHSLNPESKSAFSGFPI